MKTRMIIVVMMALGLFTAWPTTATPPHTAIVIDSGSPYFVPKSATVSSSFTLPGLAPGHYPYLCRIHPIMHGVITVTDAPQLPSQT